MPANNPNQQRKIREGSFVQSFVKYPLYAAGTFLVGVFGSELLGKRLHEWLDNNSANAAAVPSQKPSKELPSKNPSKEVSNIKLIEVKKINGEDYQILNFDRLVPGHDYSDDEEFKEHVKQTSDSCSAKPGSLNMPLANEAYTWVETMLKETKSSRARANDKTKYLIGKKTLCGKSEGFDYSFFHLAGIPLVQGDPQEFSMYESMLRTAKDFLVWTGIPSKDAFSVKDKDGNTPLHVMAALAPANQFKAFCEVFNDMIPADAWTKKNKENHSPLDILSDKTGDTNHNSFLRIAKEIHVNSEAASESCSDILHRKDDRDRTHSGIPVEGGKTMPSWPKSMFVERDDGRLALKDGSHTFGEEDSNNIRDHLPDGHTQLEQALEDRQEKWAIVKEVMKTNGAPKGSPKNPKASSKHQRDGNEAEL